MEDLLGRVPGGQLPVKQEKPAREGGNPPGLSHGEDVKLWQLVAVLP
jgi:hypothetical protein